MEGIHGQELMTVEWLAHRGEKSGVDHLPGADRDAGTDSGLEPRWSLFSPTVRIDRGAIGYNAGTQCCVPTIASKANHPAITRDRANAEEHIHLQVTKVLAL